LIDETPLLRAFMYARKNGIENENRNKGTEKLTLKQFRVGIR